MTRPLQDRPSSGMSDRDSMIGDNTDTLRMSVCLCLSVCLSDCVCLSVCLFVMKTSTHYHQSYSKSACTCSPIACDRC